MVLAPAGLNEPEVHALLRVAGESRRVPAKRNYGLLQLLLQTRLRVCQVTSFNAGRRSHVREREMPLTASALRAVRAYPRHGSWKIAVE
jgi:hypothetical protein